jgi:hypothetical protein
MWLAYTHFTHYTAAIRRSRNEVSLCGVRITVGDPVLVWGDYTLIPERPPLLTKQGKPHPRTENFAQHFCNRP